MTIRQNLIQRDLVILLILGKFRKFLMGFRNVNFGCLLKRKAVLVVRIGFFWVFKIFFFGLFFMFLDLPFYGLFIVWALVLIGSAVLIKDSQLLLFSGIKLIYFSFEENLYRDFPNYKNPYRFFFLSKITKIPIEFLFFLKIFSKFFF